MVMMSVLGCIFRSELLVAGGRGEEGLVGGYQSEAAGCKLTHVAAVGEWW